MPTRQGHVHIVSSQVKAMIESRAQDNGSTLLFAAVAVVIVIRVQLVAIRAYRIRRA